MESDAYKCLLASASREHLRRQAEFNDRFVGNVFLPAIHRQTANGPSAVSPLKHLKVIEQCILAENKREEQLARCQDERERRVWSKKFQAQRNHERNLIQALMLGTTADTEIALADVVADGVASVLARSPLHARVQYATTGITARVPSQDRVFHKAKITGGVPNTKPHIRKKFALPDCQGSPNKVKPYVRPKLSDTHRFDAKLQPVDGADTASAPSPSPHRGSRSATLLRSSPSKLSATNSLARSKSLLKQSDGIKGACASAVSPCKSSPKKTRAKPARVPRLSADVPYDPDHMHDDLDCVLAFEGPTSFLEAKRIAVAALGDNLLEHDHGESEHDNKLNERARARNELMAPIRGAAAHHSKSARPRSCPEARPRPSDGNDGFAALAVNRDLPHSRSTAAISHPGQLQCHLSSAAGSSNTSAHVSGSDAQLEPMHETTRTTDGDDDEQDEQWETYDEGTEDAISTQVTSGIPAAHINNNTIGSAHTADETLSVSSELFSSSADAERDSSCTADIETDLHVQEVETDEQAADATASNISDDEPTPTDVSALIDTSANTLPILPEVTATASASATNNEAAEADLDEQEEMEVAEVLFDLVDEIAADHLSSTPRRSVAAMPAFDISRSPGKLAATANSALLTASTHIQSAFRGHQARRAFRLALYQEALRCGMLGAMPGSTQGKSGWYQDPKSLMAYYFSIAADSGEWKQKLVVRCGRLILTPYEMHEEILSKVFVSP